MLLTSIRGPLEPPPLIINSLRPLRDLSWFSSRAPFRTDFISTYSIPYKFDIRRVNCINFKLTSFRLGCTSLIIQPWSHVVLEMISIRSIKITKKRHSNWFTTLPTGSLAPMTWLVCSSFQRNLTDKSQTPQLLYPDSILVTVLSSRQRKREREVVTKNFLDQITVWMLRSQSA